MRGPGPTVTRDAFVPRMRSAAMAAGTYEARAPPADPGDPRSVDVGLGLSGLWFAQMSSAVGQSARTGSGDSHDG